MDCGRVIQTGAPNPSHMRLTGCDHVPSAFIFRTVTMCLVYVQETAAQSLVVPDCPVTSNFSQVELGTEEGSMPSLPTAGCFWKVLVGGCWACSQVGLECGASALQGASGMHWKLRSQHLVTADVFPSLIDHDLELFVCPQQPGGPCCSSSLLTSSVLSRGA